ncbi:hypothetical protein BO78DRAFT_411711 [Aspergillus sclerotiicarbonarius CBS 121057]|uniref:tRNA (guanine(37)-N1)-methyltransferase n=1 Tax=Aspergillus sclerotiicarbonarius (strain CBS 121057 / IBT 28362) TaxID=1448318 RepID=A0A319DTP8_ASPSB|nr:hypothetical protein BO78DRAFT_411711 [Aspergillus sclerotiicarbonarius CBS 121057]
MASAPNGVQLGARPPTSPASSSPAPGQILTGKQEHYLKRELIARQVQSEIAELNSPTALQRFGAPFKSEFGEVAPVDSELPILRYIFVHHVRNFPFLDQAREKEFWQDKLQVVRVPLGQPFLESFAKKHVSSSEDRLEETKRRKLARKCEKLVELMMVSGIPTASGYEERIQFSEMEVVDRGANEKGLLVNMPEGNAIHGWDINVAAVRVTSVRRTVRYHQHAEFILRVRREGKPDLFVARRYGDFAKLHKRLRTEFPGKPLPPLPRKNKSSMTTGWFGSADDEASSVSSVSTVGVSAVDESSSSRNLTPGNHHHRSLSRSSKRSLRSPRASSEGSRETVLYREDQRVSLRAFLRTLLQNKRVAETKALEEFLTADPVSLNEEEKLDMQKRKDVDAVRIEEQKRFYEIARARAAELDAYMENFRRDIVESNGLTKLFSEIKEKPTVQDLSPKYQKFAEWLRIEVAATLYHLFLAEDNSPELFAQAKRIHSLVPYTLLKNVIRIANPAAVMAGVLDLFLAQPFGSRSLLQRIFSMTLNDGIKAFQKSIDALATKVEDPILCQKLKAFTDSDEDLKNEIRAEAAAEDVDIIVAILRTELLQPELTPEQFGKVFNAYVAWNQAVDNVEVELREGAHWFANLKQLLKLYTRQRDKAMMLSIVEEPVTLQLFRDLFTIFYEPLVRVYKSANVYSSITDFAHFADDAIAVIEKCQRQDVSADPNQTVQAFIDLCERHQSSFYKFVHEVHLHDNGLFTSLMAWIEDILEFLRKGPRGGELDMNALLRGAKDFGQIDNNKALEEINALIKWHEDRKRWHLNKTRQKMAAEGTGHEGYLGNATFRGSDFGLDEADLEDLAISDAESEGSEELDEEEDLDPITAERRRRVKQQDQLRRTAGEPVKPDVSEILKLSESFGVMLRQYPACHIPNLNSLPITHAVSHQILQRRGIASLASPGRPSVGAVPRRNSPANQETPRTPAVYTCQKPQAQRCRFFLWASDAEVREKHAVLSNSHTEPVSSTPETPTKKPRLSATGLLTPQTDRTVRYGTTMGATPGGRVEFNTPPQSAKARMMSEDMDEFEWDDENDAAVGEILVQGGQQKQQSAPLRQPDFGPPKTPSGAASVPGKRKFSDMDEKGSEKTVSFTPTSLARSFTDRTVSFSSTASGPPSSMEFSGTPTPVRFRGVGPGVGGGDSPGELKESLTVTAVKILEKNQVVMPKQAKDELVDMLKGYELQMTGVIRGRDISRIALKKKDEQIKELNERIARLEAGLDLPAMFRPPVNRAMRVLDRSFFKRTVPVSAAAIFKTSDISNVRKELTKSRDLLQLPRLGSIREIKVDDLMHKCLLLKEEVKHNDTATWSPTISELVQKGVVGVKPYDLTLEYDYWTYADIMSCILPEDMLDEIPQGFTQVGHVSHLNLREQYLPYKHLIAQVLMDKNPNVSTVIRKTEDVGSHSEFRTFPFELLAGKNDLNVIQHEQNCEFRFDYSRVYWNSRLETEHRRLVDKFRPGEMVCDVMAGVGPFAVPAGRKKIFVWANDLNPHGYEVMLDAIKRNKADKFVTPFNKDGREFIRWSAHALLESPHTVTIEPKVRRSKKAAAEETGQPLPPPEVFHRPTVFHHYVMNLPGNAIEFLDAFVGVYAGKESLFAPHTSQPLPTVHVYCFSGHSADEHDDHVDVCQRISERIGHTITTEDRVGGSGNQEIELAIHNVRLVSPNKQMFCASFRLPKEKKTMSVQLPPATHRKRTLPQGELEAASTLKLGADQNTHTLSLSEARLVINKVLENKRRGGKKYEEPENLTKTLDYLEVFARFKDEENIKAVERLLNSHTELEMFERSQLGSLCCDNAEEAKSLIPSLQHKISDGDLQELLDELTKLRNFTE